MWGVVPFVRLAVVPALALGAAVPGVAQAAPVLHERYADSVSHPDEVCGLTVHVQETFSGQFLLRDVRGSDGQAYLAHDNYRFRNVMTNVANGRWLVVRGGGVFKELSATQVEGDVWDFATMDAGQPFVLEDSSGRVVLRDRGRISFVNRFDTLGDGQPGAVLVEETVTRVSGPHPAFDSDVCSVVEDLIG